jgi:hypothetical protein
VDQKFAEQFARDQNRVSVVKGARQSLHKPTILRSKRKDRLQFKALRDRSWNTNSRAICQEKIAHRYGMTSPTSLAIRWLARI